MDPRSEVLAPEHTPKSLSVHMWTEDIWANLPVLQLPCFTFTSITKSTKATDNKFVDNLKGLWM